MNPARLLLLSSILLFDQATFAQSANTDGLATLFDLDPQEPGCVIGYARDGEIETIRGFGMANLEHGIPISAKTRFHIASISKEFTAAAIGMLALEGKLSLSDDVRTFLPEMPEFDHVITIEHLLQHSSGLANHTRLMPGNGMDYGNSYSQQEALDLVLAQGLSFKPGSKFEYGASYLVLGLVIEKISGIPLREFLQLRMFEPLGMRNSGLHDDFSIIPNRAEGYLKVDDKWINDRVRYALIGSGGIHMTLEDLLIWHHAMRNDRLLKGLARLIYDTPPIPVMQNLAYHFGFFRSLYRDAPATAHSGSYQGTKTLMYAFEPRYVTAIACNHRVDVREMTWSLIAKIAPQNHGDQ